MYTVSGKKKVSHFSLDEAIQYRDWVTGLGSRLEQENFCSAQCPDLHWGPPTEPPIQWIPTAYHSPSHGANASRCTSTPPHVFILYLRHVFRAGLGVIPVVTLVCKELDTGLVPLLSCPECSKSRDALTLCSFYSHSS
jgi:hypothetical protein